MDHKKAYPGFWHAALLCVIFVVMQLVFILPFGVLDVVFKLNLITHPLVLGTVNMVACAAVLFAGWCIGKPPMQEVFTLRRVSVRAIAGVVVASAGAVIVISELDNLVRTVLPPPEFFVRIMEDLSSPSDHFWPMVFLMVVVAPVTEEIMFRGLILRGFLKRFRIAGAFVLSAILFGAVHLNPWQFVSATVLGLMFAWWFARTQSLIPSLLGHALVNAMFVSNQSFPFKVRGFNPDELTAAAEFQPLWFDALGIFLLVAGLLLFRSATLPIKARSEQALDQQPPVILQAPDVPPPIPQ